MGIGAKIREKRQELGISQTKLAEKCGVSKQTLYKYEKEIVTNIPLDNLKAIAKGLDLTPAELMGLGEEEKKAEQTANITSVLLEDDEARELVDALLRVRINDPENYKIVKALIKSFDK